MTWLRTLDGTLINVDQLSCIEIRGGVLMVSDSRGRRFDLTPKLDEEGAAAMLDHLANRLPLAALQLIDVRALAEDLDDQAIRRRMRSAWDRALVPVAEIGR
jgi:hypothetical protein